MNQQTTFNLDSLLDGTLDDLKDLPEFSPYPPGAHKVQAMIEQDKKIKHVFYLKMKAIETVELADATETQPLVAGHETGVRYDLSNEYGQGGFKKILASAADHFGAKTTRELIEDMKSWVEALVITDLRSNKEKTQTYTNVKEFQIV